MALNGSFTGSTSNEYVQPKIVWSAKQSISGNYSNVTATLYYSRTNTGYTTHGTWSGSITINGTQATAKKIIEITYNSNTVAISSTVQVKHNADGKKSITISASGGISGTTMTSTTISSTVTLDTIARATTPTLSHSSAYMGEQVIISTPAASSSFTHELSYAFAGMAKTISTNTANTFVWDTPDMAAAIPNATSGTVTITCITKSGSTVIGTKKITMTLKVPTSVVPTISSVAVSEATDGLAAQFGAYIRGKSRVKTVITAAGAKGSTIKKYSTIFNGTTYSSSTFTSGELVASGSMSMTTTVTDSRGRTAKKTTTITILPYNPPEIAAFTAVRCTANGTESNDGDHVKVSYAYTATSLNNKNTMDMVVERKATGSDYWETVHTSTALSANTSAVLADFSTDIQWDLRLTISDWFGSSSAYPAMVPTADVIMDILANGKGVAFGKVAELSDVLDVDWKLRTLAGEEYVIIENGTNLDNLKTPNKYAGKSANNGGYTNCPLATGTFTLEVKAAGDEDQLMQRLMSCNKTAPKVYERYFYGGAWGSWMVVANFAGTVLWSGGLCMTDGHTANLSEAVSAQENGIVLVFSPYDNGAAQNLDWHSFFVPKYLVSAHSGNYHTFNLLSLTFTRVASKSLYIYDTYIKGIANNSATGTNNGITYSNSAYVLRYVLGV